MRRTAARLLRERFGEPLLLSPERSTTLVDRLAERGIVGGAVYDVLVGLAAIERNATLGTRDGRAQSTYAALGVRVVVVGSD